MTKEIEKTLQEAKEKGVIQSYSYTSQWYVEPGGIIVGLLMIGIPSFFWNLANWMLEGSIFLFPIIVGLFMTIVGVKSLFRKTK